MAPDHDILGAHGFGFAPEGRAFNRPDPFFADLEAAFDREIERFEWESVPFGWRWRRPIWSAGATLSNWIRAWRAGYGAGPTNGYRLAYHRQAKTAALALSDHWLARGSINPVVVGHSLGALVVLRAVRRAVAAGLERPRAIILLHGAAQIDDVRPLLDIRPADRVHNVYGSNDSVVRSLATWATGREDQVLGAHGLRWGRPDWWADLDLDDELIQADLRGSHGWEVRADEPGRADHGGAYRNARNWPLLRALARGGL